jgi:hypothetical protein
MYKKESYLVSAAIVMAIATMMLFPVIGIAGSLEPAATPAPTMKTLDQMPPTWSQRLQCDATACPRFELVFDGAAVLDKETGLVWEQSPSITEAAWIAAVDNCATKDLGGRNGWHLPTVEQLASLMDTSVAGSLKLPAGHLFTNVHPECYWTATTRASASNFAWSVCIGHGLVFNNNAKSEEENGWCVRGGQSYDAY